MEKKRKKAETNAVEKTSCSIKLNLIYIFTFCYIRYCCCIFVLVYKQFKWNEKQLLLEENPERKNF